MEPSQAVKRGLVLAVVGALMVAWGYHSQAVCGGFDCIFAGVGQIYLGVGALAGALVLFFVAGVLAFGEWVAERSPRERSALGPRRAPPADDIDAQLADVERELAQLERRA